eukprot:Skav226118  [mRNA]  locus=scaffold1047:61528:65921:- [translate_table: standard]
MEALVGRTLGEGFPTILSQLVKYLDVSKLGVRSKTQPTGDVFPLPTSLERLGELPGISEKGRPILQALALALNSYAGSSVKGGGKISSAQRTFLTGLIPDVEDVVEWSECFQSIDWSGFFRYRRVDYQGDEVATAQYTSWKNVSPAIPKEVGSVNLSELLSGGLLHYVQSFESYLLEEHLRTYTKPPRVMVADADWEGLCVGLLGAGICKLLPESSLCHVEGKPLLNGLFGVTKGEWQQGVEMHRLIMNLVPLNAICKGIQGDVATLPSWSTSGPLSLLPHEELVVSSEDVRCFFYIFSVPSSWHRYLAFNKVVPAHLHPHSGERHYLCATVLPMGFKNSVSIAQAVHRTIVGKARLRDPQQLQPQHELRKDKNFPTGSQLHRVYLDNFDELEKVDERTASLISGRASDAVLALRSEYEFWGIPRHPKKSVERSFKAEVQGAILDGRKGCAYPKPEKVLKYTQLGMLLLSSRCCSQKQLQVVAGGLVYMATFRRPLMGGLNKIWTFIEEFNHYPPVTRLDIPMLVKLEVARFLAMIPLARLNFRASPSPMVTASDASCSGGGVTASTGLTNFGQVAASCAVRGDVPDDDGTMQVLTIGLFDGIAALRVAADTLGLPIIGHISIEKDPCAARVVESRFPSAMLIDDVTKVDLAMVQGWACQYTQVALIVIGAGPPCQGVSGLNSERRGALKDHRSSLFSHVPRIEQLVRCSFPWAQVHTLAESVQSMDTADREVMSTSFAKQPWAIDASGISLARRPRLYWVSWELQESDEVEICRPNSSSFREYGTVNLSANVDAREYLTPGWIRCGEEALPTFTTSRPRSSPGRKPAGLDQLTPEEKQEWTLDSFRFPPYQYQHKHHVQRQGVTRLVNVAEREAIMGFPVGYTTQCMPKSQHKSIEYIDARLSLLGNSWNVTVIVWLLSQLCHPLGLCPRFSPQRCVDATKPGAGTTLASFLSRPPMARTTKKLRGTNSVVLVKKLLNMISIKGEDILISSPTEESLRYHRLRASLPSGLWAWRTVCSWLWKGSREHINVLELRAVLCALRRTLEGATQAEMGRKLKAHVEGRSKEQRQAIRQNLGPLRQLTVQPQTRARYNRALERFFTFLRDRDLSLPRQRYLLDPLVSEYLEHLWASGEGRSLASDTVASLQDRDPLVKGTLGGSWRLLKTWAANEIPNRAPPLTEEALHTLLGYALFHNQQLFALSLMVAFYGLLRTGEVLNIKSKDVSQASSTSVAVISLGLTKGGQRAGAMESVTISERDTLRRLWQWKSNAKPGDSLCPPPHRWRKLFNQAIESLELQDYAYRPYSLRRGGATFYFQHHGQLDRLLVQGRWQSSKTARLYLNEGLAILAETQLQLKPHARTLLTQYRRSKGNSLPPLEHANKVGRAGGTGKDRKKRQKR